MIGEFGLPPTHVPPLSVAAICAVADNEESKTNPRRSPERKMPFIVKLVPSFASVEIGAFISLPGCPIRERGTLAVLIIIDPAAKVHEEVLRIVGHAINIVSL